VLRLSKVASREGLQPLLYLRLFARLIDALPTVLGGNWQPVLTAVIGVSVVQLVGASANMLSNTLAMRLRMTVGITINEQVMNRAAATPLLDLETPAFHDRLTRAMKARGNMFPAVTAMAGMLRGLIAVVSILGVLASLHWGAALHSGRSHRCGPAHVHPVSGLPHERRVVSHRDRIRIGRDAPRFRCHVLPHDGRVLRGAVRTRQRRTHRSAVGAPLRRRSR
jgi:hypothetical protein